jgi:L-aminopeptidase/D-esterase-like protein
VTDRLFVPGRRNAITDVEGIRVGHVTKRAAATGCTVILTGGATTAVDVRGGAPGTRETDVLAPANLVRRCDAILLAGGSAFGLAAADGVMRWLRERGEGFPTRAGKVPIVTAGVLFDLGIGRADAWPTADDGYAAAARARSGPVAEGSVGAGAGATVAKLAGPERALKGGVGTASLAGPKGLVAGALVVTNALGVVVDPATGDLTAGPRGDTPGEMWDLEHALARRPPEGMFAREATTLAVAATNAAADHYVLQRLAAAVHDAIARCVVPVHTFGDGDIAWVAATGAVPVEPSDVLTLAVMVQRAVEFALLRSVRAAHGLAGVPSAAEWAASGS